MRSFTDLLCQSVHLLRRRVVLLAVHSFCLGLLCSCATDTAGIAETPPQPPALPPDQKIFETVGRGDPLVLQIRVSDGQEINEVRFIVDTGSSVTILDKSFERTLGSRLGKKPLVRTFSGSGIKKANVYAAPKLYLGNVRLMTGTTILMSDIAGTANDAYQAILGMDCLKYYCIQMDFAAGKMRFLDSNRLKREGLGRALSMEDGMKMPVVLPVVSMKLLEDRSLRFVVDTGFCQNEDGTLPPDLIRQASRKHGAKDTGSHFFSRVVSLENLDIDGESYRTLSFAEVQMEGGGVEGFIGLSFLRRHVVTFDFPNRTLYLRRASSAPGA